MAQLTDDCFAFSGPLLPVADMERMIVERIAPVTEVEPVALDDALGRIIAADVLATEDLPPFDNSAVDGFAVRHADLSAGAETRLVIAERVMAGHAAARPLAPHEAIRIFTGAPMPAGADTVFMQEDCRLDGGPQARPHSQPDRRPKPAVRRRGLRGHEVWQRDGWKRRRRRSG